MPSIELFGSKEKGGGGAAFIYMQINWQRRNDPARHSHDMCLTAH